MRTSNPEKIPKLSQAFNLLLLVFFLMFFVSILIGLLLGLGSNSQEIINPNSLAVIIFGSMLVSYWVLWRSSLDYFRECFLLQLSSSSAAILLCVILGFLTAYFVLQLQTWFPSDQQLDTSISQALNADLWGIVLIYICVLVIAPIAEEYLFRGILFDSLCRQWGSFIAIGVSAFIFTLFHLFEYHQYWVAWFAVFCLAVLLAIVRYKSESMLNPIIIHATYNSTLLIMGSN